MKHLVKTVPLRFFEEEGSGQYGLANDNAIDRGFDAFYDGIGIFHDVFEHWFEGRHKYFLGDAAFNIGGEMAAMGAAWYYFDVLRVDRRQLSQGYPFADSIRDTTELMIREAIEYGSFLQFGESLVCAVPNQKPIDNEELEFQIRKLHSRINRININESNSYDGAPSYKESVTFQKIANLYRYGFRMAERLVDNNFSNHSVIDNFIRIWDRFCTNFDAQELANNYHGITFRIYKEEGIISWRARLEAKPGFFPHEYNEVPTTITSETFLR